MTVAEELENRGRCIYGLRGVLVAVDGRGEPVGIASASWAAGGVLELALVDGRSFPADRLALRSPWPVVCCTPRTPNPWNQDRRDPPPQGTRPPD